jgi:hypothetical protein
MADDKKGADTTANAATKDAAKPLFEAGTYMNTEPRVLNITQAGEGAEMRSIAPGANVELTADDATNKHVHHFVKHGMLKPAESAEAKKARETAELEQAKVEAAAAAKK